MGYEFKVGDKVRLGVYKTSVSKVTPVGKYPVLIYVDNNEVWFSLDGTPSNDLLIKLNMKLKLRKFKKKPVPMELWVNHYIRGMGTHLSASSANTYFLPDRIGGKAWKYRLEKGQV